MSAQREADLESAFLYLLEATLATIEDMAGKKSRSKSEYTRQKFMAQCSIEHVRWMHHTQLPDRVEAVRKCGYSVDAWAARQELPFVLGKTAM